MTATARLGEFVVGARPPAGARARAATAVLDTVGVTLAGASEPAARIVQAMVATEGEIPAECLARSAARARGSAALASSTAAPHSTTTTCVLSRWRIQAPLVPATLAVGELEGSSGCDVLDAYFCWLRDRSAARTADEPTTLSARLALHGDAGNDPALRRR